MSSPRVGAQAVIRAAAPKALYVHCSSHRLNRRLQGHRHPQHDRCSELGLSLLRHVTQEAEILGEGPADICMRFQSPKAEGPVQDKMGGKAYLLRGLR